ncbi:hypothetical protein [Flavobacterium sp.]|uniref:hypothetical protein n=1 Tax=Flavobacterium sp. TaxID=239 RepID=UPI001B6C290E|nr:hypothetical protein [Flavobacterium sp.]MBP6127560.1 hypothetical protein [Flavobacterium sp.]
MIGTKKNIIIIIAALLLISCSKKNDENATTKTNNKEEKETVEVTKKITLEDLKFENVISDQGELATADSFIVKDFFGLSKDTIQIKFNSDNQVKFFSIVEQRSGRIVKTFKKTSDVDFTYDVFFDNPFSVKIYFPKESYYNLEVSRKSGSVDNYLSKAKLIRDSVVVGKKTNKSKIGTTMAFEKVFNQPKKFIVSSTFSMSGESKVYVPIEIPKNTVEFIYTLRISGEDETQREDGRLFNDVNRISKKVKVFGLPLWESEEKSTSLSREILNSLFPPKKDEDYTLNVFFFDKQKEIKKFLQYPGKQYASAFKYDINNSAFSTQSRVGLVKKPYSGFSYIGLQSTSSFSDTYAWLDVVALYEKTFHYEIRYRLQK